MNEKLGRGEVFDQSEANRLINGVIIALINKNTGIDEHYEARITDLEVENNTARTDLNLMKVGFRGKMKSGKK